MSEEVAAERNEEDLVGAEFEEGGSGAWSHYELQTMDDGSITGMCSTNDDGDTGEPGQYADWKVKYRDKASMLKQLSGGSHMGFTGVRVEVYLDGEAIGQRLPRGHEEL
jgi:hypothetical protein